MSERYRRGVDIIQRLASGQLEQFMTSKIAEVAPDFARMAVEFAFGDLYSRSVLDLKSREIAAISSLATLGGCAAPQLRNHVRAAQNIGICDQEIVEILMQSAIYAGIPAALNALSACYDLLTDESRCFAGGCQAAASRDSGHG